MNSAISVALYLFDKAQSAQFLVIAGPVVLAILTYKAASKIPLLQTASLSRHKNYALLIDILINISAPLSFVIYIFAASAFFTRSSVSINLTQRISLGLSTILLTGIASVWLALRLASYFSRNKAFDRVVIVVTSLVTYLRFLEQHSTARYFAKSVHFSSYLTRIHINIGSTEFTMLDATSWLFAGVIVIWLNGIALRIIRITITNIKSLDSNAKSVSIKLLNISVIALIVIGAFGIMGLNLKNLAMFSSAAVVGISFGFQRVASNFLSGIVLSFEKSLQEDHIISLNEGQVIGTVRSMRMRYVLLEDFDGREVMIPNELLTSTSVTNLTYTSNKYRIRLDLVLEFGADLPSLKKSIDTVIQKNQYRYTLENSAFHLLEFRENGVAVAIFFWLNDINKLLEGRTAIILDIITSLAKANVKISPLVAQVQISDGNNHFKNMLQTTYNPDGTIKESGKGSNDTQPINPSI